MRKTPVTSHGLVGLDWVRMTAAPIGTGYLFVRADGSDAVIGTLPTKFRTSGDLVNVTSRESTLVCNMSAVPSAWNDAEGNAHALPAHAWKTTMTLSEVCKHFGAPELAASIRRTYKALKG